MIQRLLAFCAVILSVLPSSSSAQPALIFQNDTVIHSVVGRLVHSGAGYQNASYYRSLRIKDMYFAHQADSIFIVNTKFDSLNFVLPAQSFSSMGFRFRSPMTAMTVHDTLVTVCAYTDAPDSIFTILRPYVGYTTIDSSSDSSRVCVYGHDCIFLGPINLGDTVYGELCYELEFIPLDSITITSVAFVGRDSASFHLVDSTFPKSAFDNGRISFPYFFTPARLTGVKRYEATAIARMTSQDGVLCHESDIAVEGLLTAPYQDSIPVRLYSSDTLALHFTTDSTIFRHVLEFQNNSSGGVKIDSAYMTPGTCFELDAENPPYGTKLDTGSIFYVNIHYIGDSTGLANGSGDCSDTLYIVAENTAKILSFPMRHTKPQAAGVSIPIRSIGMSLMPNPSNRSVDIESGSESMNISIEIYDILGNRVASHAGPSWKWSGEDFNGGPVPNGPYIVRISEGSIVGDAGSAVSQRLLMRR